VAYTGTKPIMKNIKPEVAGTPALGGEPGASGATAATKATSGQPGKAVAELAL
jgi:hypothetical protein